MDDLVAQFMAITGSSDASTASTYLEMSGGNVEMAIGLFLEHGSGSSAPSSNSMGGGGRGGGMSSHRSQMDADAAVAAAMMASEQEDAVRAPDATRTMRLMDEGPSGVGGAASRMMMHSLMDPSLRMMQEMMDEQLQRSAFDNSPPVMISSRRGRGAREAVDLAAASAAAESKDNDNADEDYNYDEDDDAHMHDSYDDDDDDDDDALGGGRPGAPSLQDMFSPPTHLLHRAGGFQGARQMAKDSKRWLLVNIQKDDEFSSHALNRDVWRNDLVENLVREGFIFWQERDVAPEGLQFVQRYKVQQFPHISIIDPRTARLLWSKEGWTQQNPMSAERFAEIVMDFCSRHSLDRAPVAPDVKQRPKPANNGSTASRSSSGSSTASAMTSDAVVAAAMMMTEEEQLEAAVKASMADQQQQPTAAAAAAKADDDDDDDDSVECLGNSLPVEAPPPPLSLFQTWLEMPVPADSGSTRIQFRMPNGSRVVRAFEGATTTVQTIYAFVAQSLDSEAKAAQKEFTLMAGFPPKDLKPSMEKTLEQCSLKGETVTVRWT